MTDEEIAYTQRGSALVKEAAAECAASGERMDKLAEDIDELVTDVQLDARERIIALLRLLLENDLNAYRLSVAVSLAPASTSNTYSPPITCKLPVDHDDPFHRAGEVSWETVEYALGRSAPEGLPRLLKITRGVRA